jgi:hypothetical protein
MEAQAPPPKLLGLGQTEQVQMVSPQIYLVHLSSTVAVAVVVSVLTPAEMEVVI